MKNFHLFRFSPNETRAAVDRELQLLDISVDVRLKNMAALPVVFGIERVNGTVEFAATAFLIDIACRSNSVEHDTARTYGECLIQWLEFCLLEQISPSETSEIHLQTFRNHLLNRASARSARLTNASVVLLVSVAIQFVKWSHVSKWGVSRFGESLATRVHSVRREYGRIFAPLSTPVVTLPRIIPRIPAPLDNRALQLVLSALSPAMQLAAKWAVCTGLRRAEICRLSLSALSSAQALGGASKLSVIRVLRKGGREHNVYVPRSLIDESEWFVLTTRGKPVEGEDQYLFINTRGRALSKQSISRAFHKASTLHGFSTTFHCLRHTYALVVLDVLERCAAAGSEINPLKTLQILMGHANVDTTEIYLRAFQVTSPSVEQALGFLYGLTNGEA